MATKKKQAEETPRSITDPEVVARMAQASFVPQSVIVGREDIERFLNTIQAYAREIQRLREENRTMGDQLKSKPAKKTGA